MKLVKRIGILVGGLVVLAALAVGIALFFVDSIAKTAIEKGGTYALGVPTTVADVKIGVLGGTFAMSGLDVANPSGYESRSFLQLGSGAVAANLGSVTKAVVEVPKLELSTIRVSLERNSNGANYQKILDNLKKFESKDPARKPKDEGGGKRFVIKELVVRDVEVKVDLIGMAGGATAVTVPINEIKLKDVGSAEGGVNAGEIVDVVVKAILATAADVGGGIIPKDVLGELQGGLSQLGGLGEYGVEVIGKAGEEAKKLLGDVGKTLEDAGSEVKKGLEGIGDLFNKEKKKE